MGCGGYEAAKRFAENSPDRWLKATAHTGKVGPDGPPGGGEAANVRGRHLPAHTLKIPRFDNDIRELRGEGSCAEIAPMVVLIMGMRHAQDELVWIDNQGVLHPLGELASERMRTRNGAFFRMFPTPHHVLFMRYTGQDGRRDAEDGAVVRLAGEIVGPGFMCDIVAVLAQSGWSGLLSVQGEGVERNIYVENGRVVGARTTCPDEHLGQVLYRFGVISEIQLEQILDRARAGQLFGAAAIDLGILTSEQVYTYLRKQVERIAMSVLTVADGMYCFLDGFDEEEIPFRHGVSLNSLLMDGVTQMDEMRFFRQRIPSADYIPEKRADAKSPPDECLPLWELIDNESSVGDLSRVLNRSEFETTKLVFQLYQGKQITISPPRTGGGPRDTIETANSVLRIIHQEVDQKGKGTALRTNLEGFADEVYELMFREAGPYENGSFDPDPMIENVSIIVSGGNSDKFLKEMLYDYVQFALFSASSLLMRGKDNSLGKQVEPLMSKLRPIG